jgi:hypothetical protein
VLRAGRIDDEMPMVGVESQPVRQPLRRAESEIVRQIRVAIVLDQTGCGHGPHHMLRMLDHLVLCWGSRSTIAI